MAEHLKTVASNLSSSSSLQNYSPAHAHPPNNTNESVKSQQPGAQHHKGNSIPRIKKLDIVKRQSENVTPMSSKRAERGEINQNPIHQQVVVDSHFQRKVKEILSNPSTSFSTRNRYTVNRTNVKVNFPLISCLNFNHLFVSAEEHKT